MLGLAENIGHELRNIVTPILRALAVAQRELSEVGRSVPCLQTADLAARRALSLSFQLLWLRGSGLITAPTPSVELTEVLNRGRSLFEVGLPSHALLLYRLGSSLPATRVPPHELEALVLAIITNAGDAIRMYGGHVTVRTGINDEGVEPPPLDDHAVVLVPPGESCENRHIWLDVEDDGEGIPVHVLRDLGHPFFTTRSGRRGLGLHFARELLRAYGGGLVIRSTEDGTRVRVTLPLASQPTE